jgi:N-glycosylase/DNA lyase
MEFTMGLDSPFSLDYTLESGQVFRWEKKGEWWLGVVSGGALKLRSESGSIRCVSSNDALGSAFVRRYFRLDEPFEDAMGSIVKDDVMKGAVQRFYGLRLIQQERWECLASFLLATNANIPRIRKMVASICSAYGDPFEFEGSPLRTFPRPEVLAEARLSDLMECGLGYRASFLKRVARAVSSGRIDFTDLADMDYEDAKAELLRKLLGEKILLGVGPKVADCVLLYSFGKNEAFPIDVWISRELLKSYPKLIPRRVRSKLRSKARSKLSSADYNQISKATRDYFGRYAGYAQLYLYSAARSTTVSSP